MLPRCLLLAGSIGPERVPARPDPDDADWYLPLHVRQERATRARLAGQVGAGADVICAPTWLTHRRALLPVGETRRVAVWTALAVRVAREALELAADLQQAQPGSTDTDPGRRADAPDAQRRRTPESGGTTSGGSAADPGGAAAAADELVTAGLGLAAAARDAAPRPRPLVAGVLPALAAADPPATSPGGRSLASQGDYHEAAGALADAEPDLLLVEAPASTDEARLAIGAAIETGLPTWAALGPDVLAELGTEAWLDWGRGQGLARVLVPPPLAAWSAVTEGALPWGGLVQRAAEAGPWLEAGAGAIACLDGATSGRLAGLRRAIDDHERPFVEAARAAEARWSAWIARAAELAPGGSAAWVGPPPLSALPAGFEWHVLPAEEADGLPDDRYRLVVAAVSTDRDLGRTLQRGGVLVERERPGRAFETEVRLLALDADADAERTLAIYRREG
jgi:hypothetical protein